MFRMKLKLPIRRVIKYLLLPIGIMYCKLIKNIKEEILILMYHRVNDNVFSELAINVDDFEWQMEYLKSHGYKVISMDDAYNMLISKGIDGRYVVLSFDDGYEDFYLNAYPVLRRYFYPSILYLVPGFTGTDKVYWWDEGIDDTKLMSWETVSKLSRSPIVDFGCHTLNHYDMTKLSRYKLKYEITMSKRTLEKKLGREIRHFSYPRGIYSKDGEKVIRDLYQTGVLISNGKRITNRCLPGDEYKLHRIPILRSDDRVLFAARLKGWLVAEEFARRFVNSIRFNFIYKYLEKIG